MSSKFIYCWFVLTVVSLLFAVATSSEMLCLAASGESDTEIFVDTKMSDGHFINKMRHYFDVYERHFARFRKQKVVTMLEMGVQSGGSIEMWKYYFGDRLIYHGIDINPLDKQLENKANNIFIHTGSQANKTWLHEVASSIPNIDIVIDDASHQSLHMFIAFKTIFDLVQPNGVYLVEDTHTNYWKNKEFDEGPHSKHTFMFYAKHLVDELNGFNSESFGLGKATKFTSTCTSIAFYDSIVVFEKGPHTRLQHAQAGKIHIPFNGESRKPTNIDFATYKEFGVAIGAHHRVN